MSPKSNADGKFIWVEGRLVPYEDAKIHVLSHSFHYGNAAFEGIRAYQTASGDTAIFRGPEHFQRFVDSIKALGYTSSYTPTDYLRASCECIKANGFQECYIRPIAFLDDSFRGLKLPESPRVINAIAVWKWGKYMGDEGQKNGIRVAVSTLRRPDISSALTWAKLTGNYITSVLARQEATQNKFDEAILLDPEGFVAEGSGENIFVVKDKKILTPHTGYILPGITRDSVIQLARDMGYEVVEQNITRNQLYIADEVFFTGTAVEVTPIREVDHHRIADGRPGPVTRALFEAFFKCVRGESEKYRGWLTQV